MRRRRQARTDDTGSILPLTMGYAVLALAAVLVCADATSLYLAQKQLDAVADAAALAGADGFTLTVDGGAVAARLTPAAVSEQAHALVGALGAATWVESAATPDGLSARVSVATVWHPPVAAVFVPDGFVLHATATSRTALR